MADRPILFSGPMVRALLAGTKTQTRREIKPRPWNAEGDCVNIDAAKSAAYGIGADGRPCFQFEHPLGGPLTAYVSRIAVGDRLYVRESWNWTFIKDLAPGETLGRTLDECCEANGGFACPVGDGIVYAATNAHEHPEFGKARWKPSMHMPRYASRLTLTVTDVRVQRLKEISAADAIDEGLADRSTRAFLPAAYGLAEWPDEWCGAPRDAYRRIWESINGAGSWDANPWVAAYSFTVQRGNIDQLARAV